MEATAWIALLVAALGLILLAAQLVFVRRHRAGEDPAPRSTGRPGISVLKPLCGLDDDLTANLERFAVFAYAPYELVLGVESVEDPAYPVARKLAARLPHRVRVVVQRGETGLNPKVNQLIGMAAAARHDVLVVSDSNVRVDARYLDEIAALLEDPDVGVVTHPVIGVGETTLGARLDNLHLSTSIGPGIIAAKHAGGQDLVTGKSMAFRRADLVALGGFASAKDVLAEDYVLGERVRTVLGKKVALARTPVVNLTRRRDLAGFVDRYRRWAIIQRATAGRAVFALQLLLNPILFALLALAFAPGAATIAGFAAVAGAKALLDGAVARALGRRFGGADYAAVPLKDLLLAGIWAAGMTSSRVSWRGHELDVLPGTRLLPVLIAASAKAARAA